MIELSGPIKLAIAGFMLVLALGAFTAYRTSLINTGWDRALEAVKKQDGTAKEGANKAQRTVDQCYESGGAWSTITGKCTEGKS